MPSVLVLVAAFSYWLTGARGTPLSLMLLAVTAVWGLRLAGYLHGLVEADLLVFGDQAVVRHSIEVPAPAVGTVAGGLLGRRGPVRQDQALIYGGS
mgnify:CR=1 FL=1